MDGCDEPLGFKVAHGFQPWEQVDAEAKQPSDVTHNEMDKEDKFGWHNGPLCIRMIAVKTGDRRHVPQLFDEWKL